MELNVFFEEAFWIGIFYLNDGSERFVEKVVFGAEPKDGEVYNYVLFHSQNLSFKAAYQVKIKSKSKNPKRVLRIIKKQSSNLAIGTKSMQALKKQYEQSKHESKINQNRLKKDKKEYLFQLKQERRKAKKKGH